MAEEINSAYSTVDAIVNSALADLGEGSTHKYDQFLHWALECLADFHMDSAQEVKTVRLEMNDYNSIDWPNDYVDWCKIGVQVGDKVKTFGVNDDLPLAFDLDGCDQPEKLAIADPNALPDNAQEWMSGFWFNNYTNSHGELLGRFFGIGGGSNRFGYYRVNKERKQILFDSRVKRTTVYLEYIGTGFNPCETTVVNQYAKKLLKYYIHWQRARFKFGTASAEAQTWQQEYHDEHRLVRARLSDLTPAKIIELSRKNYKQSIKQ